MLDAVTGCDESAHGMSQGEQGQLRILMAGHLHDLCGIVDEFVKVFYIASISPGFAVTAVVKTIDGKTPAVEFCRDIIITSRMFAKSVNDDYRSFRIFGNILRDIKINAVFCRYF